MIYPALPPDKNGTKEERGKERKGGVNIAVFCSGYGSNFQAIIDASKKGLLDAKIVLMVCDNKDALSLQRAKKENIPTLLVLKENFKTKEDFENKIINQIEQSNVSLICLAGFMRILSAEFIKKYQNKILNVHPALLPAFKGAHGIKDAFDYAVKVTGATVHFVTEQMDSGPIILQQAVKVDESDTLKTLEEKIHKVEHKLYPEAIRLFIDGKLEIRGRKVRIYPHTNFEKK